MTDALIPLGLTQFTERYRQADQLYHIYNDYNGVDKIVSHSLGSHLAMKLNEKYNIPYVAYATPTVPWQSVPVGSKRFSHYLDPISFGDTNAEHNFYKGLNPHSYGGY